MFCFSNVSKCFYDGENLRYILRNVNINIDKSEMVALLGESGSGKTTFLSMLGQIDFPTSGEIYYNKQLTLCLNEKEKRNIRKNKIGFILQNNFLIDFLNVFENIETSLIFNGFRKTEAKRLTIEALENVGMSDFIYSNIYSLSGGEKQRISIARAIASKPELILADEPTGSLDEENSLKIITLLKKINREGVTIITATHSNYIAEQFKRKIIIKNQNIVDF